MSDLVGILLVDDEQRNLEALEAILDDPGYSLLRAHDADRALRLLLENDVAAIILDVKMPGVSGFELARIIKGTRRFREIPIVFLTAHLIEDRDILMGYGAGAVDYLTKPVNPQVLRHKVAVLADLFRKTRALAELNEHLELRVQQRTAELEESEEALRRANEQKDRFLATLAHELRGPLAPLRMGLSILLNEAERSPTAEHTLAVMNRQLDHMVRLVDDLLDVARIARGTMEIRKEDVELSAVIDRAREATAPAFSKRKQTVSVDAQEAVRMFADSTRIAQIVANLLGNASRHSPDGSRVRIELRREGAAAVVRVVDQGMGIPQDQLDRVFDMFTRIKRSAPSAGDGLGIGLSLSRQLAELHGGTLAAASDGEGTGSTFTLTLPSGGVRIASGAKSAAQVPTIGPVPPLRVVVVEDNEDSADMMSTWLRQLGHTVSVAHAGADGIAIIVAQRPDIVLCDIGLPGMDGVEVCRRLVVEMPAPPVMVALTGWGMDVDKRRTLEAGFHHHLVKPVELDRLRRVLQSVGELRASRRSA